METFNRTPFLNPDLSFLNYLFLIKAVLVFGSLVYFLFSLIVIRQVDLLSKTLKTKVSPFLLAGAVLNSMFALALLLFSLLEL
ncbi:hypothetical protein A2716_03105 [candidate division WWE3 bacterium RIFCSPHIGHO2_01_FULL_40_23]|uniref:Uncharacterized protein n=1 Tax=candidate division WWE3 bacterium RIFCSPLOWO2_01_FULL_41_18 TaxID=1802625 RepID=A0A1F4VC91_UNCKA|nr:MAG: hypothetical protein A2716_03105 [candidate division WWE3 bacterium RIFCSPHIGHO2_01_FULL_40_23]OGC54815.1 MAG: hypothetical protein A3A78_05060 [candidate division WWE3 bacterium RIFCSPLOWO2_01_FULL_41_18]